jgi:hypothetical protein
MSEPTLPPPMVPAEVDLLDPCTCMRDGKPCRVCLLWDEHLSWLDGRPGSENAERFAP